MVVTTDQLCATLEPLLDSPVTGLSRGEHAYRSSFALEQLRVSLADGRVVDVVFKSLDRTEMTPEAQALKPEFLHDPTREILTYEVILGPAGLGTARCYGTLTDADRRLYWLFIEKVSGTELYQLGEMELWEETARWLGSMHSHLAPEAVRFTQRVPLLSFQRESGSVWLSRARHVLAGAARSGSELERLEDRYGRARTRLHSLPVTVVHGEFYPSNVLISMNGSVPRVCPIDWEMTGIAPGVLDFAALASGRWTETDRRTLAGAYLSGRTDLEAEFDMATFLADMDCALLYLAVRWIGWFGDRPAYRKHRSDWIGEAFRLAERIV